MDKLKLKLSTKFMKGIAAKIISKAIYNKFGFKPEIQIYELEIEMKDDKIHFHINADGEVNKEILSKIKNG